MQIASHHLDPSRIPLSPCTSRRSSTSNRFISPETQLEQAAAGKLATLKDLNWKQPLKLAKRTKEALHKQMALDTQLLCDGGVMDYSLLVATASVPPLKQRIGKYRPGLQPTQFTAEWGGMISGGNADTKGDKDQECKMYFVAIIDCLQNYDIQKSLETVGKTALGDMKWLGVALRVEQPTVTCPRCKASSLSRCIALHHTYILALMGFFSALHCTMVRRICA